MVRSFIHQRGEQISAFIAIACLGLLAAGRGSSSPSTSSTGSSMQSGAANVAYASSLQYLNENVVSPAFTKAQGG